MISSTIRAGELIDLFPTWSASWLLTVQYRAKHQALSPDHPMKSSVQVSVLKAPGEPFVEGYSKGEKLRSGQEVELVCRSFGGNPPAQLVTWKVFMPTP